MMNSSKFFSGGSLSFVKFNSTELISAFREIKNLSISLDTALNLHSYLIQLNPITVLVNQLKETEKQLNVGSLMTIDEKEAVEDWVFKNLKKRSNR